MTTKPIPDGTPTVTPYLTIRGAAEAMTFYEAAFGAEERCRLPGPDGKTIGHAEMRIGDSLIMLADELPAWGNHSPETLKGSPVGFAVYVADADAALRRAVAAGATIKHPLENKFYGDRTATVTDPFGYDWTLMTHIEDVAPEEISRRLAALYTQKAARKH